MALALRQERLDQAVQLIGAKVAAGEVAAAVLHVRSGDRVLNQAFGAARTPRAAFLLASITKPMTATALMILADRGDLSLKDPVQNFIPEFQGGERNRVILRHLLTHTSGLPDMLPENDELRKRHAPLKEFVAAACRTPLLFSPGTKVQYQSMGVLLAGEIVERVARRPLRDFLRTQVFEPLGMPDTSLGLGGRNLPETMQCQVDEHTDWDWNSTYWRDLGSPWGGAHSTASDVSRLLQYFVHPDPPVLNAETAAAMVTNQNQGLNLPWGLGWMMGEGRLANGASSRTFGHSGSTGTIAWLDPEKDLSMVLLTTKPAAISQKTLLGPVSDAIASAA
jgi:CubicO group peptidase (beta-lactamase class C family)